MHRADELRHGSSIGEYKSPGPALLAAIAAAADIPRDHSSRKAPPLPFLREPGTLSDSSRHRCHATDLRLTFIRRGPCSERPERPEEVDMVTMSGTALLILLVIAAVCGAIGKMLGGGARGGLITSMALGF